MRIHCLQHVPFEGPGSIGTWLHQHGHTLTYTRFFDSPVLPDPADVDLVVAMGGPMSVNDEQELPWLVAEKRFLRECIGAGRMVLGVCLGAQLVASALGARIYRNPEKEIGWFPIRAVDAADTAAFRLPSTANVFHWHGETFDLPPGAIHLARSEACVNQAFQIGRTVIGLQFHLETTPASARELVTHCRDELVPSRYVQTEAAILGADAARYEAINSLMAEVLDYLAGARR